MNSSAASMYQQLAVAIANIQTSDKLTGEAKTTAINAQVEFMKAGLAALTDVTKLDLGKYFPSVEWKGGNDSPTITPPAGGGWVNANPYAQDK
jgi:hypothetical protein